MTCKSIILEKLQECFSWLGRSAKGEELPPVFQFLIPPLITEIKEYRVDFFAGHTGRVPAYVVVTWLWLAGDVAAVQVDSATPGSSQCYERGLHSDEKASTLRIDSKHLLHLCHSGYVNSRWQNWPRALVRIYKRWDHDATKLLCRWEKIATRHLSGQAPIACGTLSVQCQFFVELLCLSLSY